MHSTQYQVASYCNNPDCAKKALELENVMLSDLIQNSEDDQVEDLFIELLLEKLEGD